MFRSDAVSKFRKASLRFVNLDSRRSRKQSCPCLVVLSASLGLTDTAGMYLTRKTQQILNFLFA